MVLLVYLIFTTVRMNSFCEGKNYTQFFFSPKTRKLRLREISSFFQRLILASGRAKVIPGQPRFKVHIIPVMMLFLSLF